MPCAGLQTHHPVHSWSGTVAMSETQWLSSPSATVASHFLVHVVEADSAAVDMQCLLCFSDTLCVWCAVLGSLGCVVRGVFRTCVCSPIGLCPLLSVCSGAPSVNAVRRANSPACSIIIQDF